MYVIYYSIVDSFEHLNVIIAVGIGKCRIMSLILLPLSYTPFSGVHISIHSTAINILLLLLVTS